MNPFFESYKVQPIFKYLILMIIAYVILANYIGDIIIYIRNSTKYYHDFYIKEIVETIEKEKIVLLIEDVDRLPMESIREVFTIVSSINNALSPKTQKCVGILTIDPNNLEQDKKMQKEFLELKNKTCFKELMILKEKNSILKYEKEIRKYVKSMKIKGEFIDFSEFDKRKEKSRKSFRELNHFKVEILEYIRQMRESS